VSRGRLAVWAGVVATIAAVAFGIWYYVRDDYPLQLTSTEITGLAVRAVTADGPVSGYIAHPPAELAQWVSSMEKVSSDVAEPVTTTVTIERSDGPALRLAIDGPQAAASWVDADGSATPPVSVQVNQAFLWYLHGVRDALASTSGGMVPRQAPAGAGASPSPGSSASTAP
jgi:hypothetical protein